MSALASLTAASTAASTTVSSAPSDFSFSPIKETIASQTQSVIRVIETYEERKVRELEAKVVRLEAEIVELNAKLVRVRIKAESDSRMLQEKTMQAEIANDRLTTIMDRVLAEREARK